MATNDFRPELRPTAERYRKNARIAPWVVFAWMVCGGLGYWLKSGVLFAIAFGSVVLFVIVGLALAIFVPIECPGCDESPFNRLGDHCPECGAAALNRTGLPGAASCSACGKSLRRGTRNARTWRVRYCTHCGGHLDDEGVRAATQAHRDPSLRSG